MEINLARFDLVSIHLAVLCAERGSLSAATKEIHCSLSTGSYRIAMLEQTFGKRLFKRDRLGMHVTAAGVLFLPHAKAILEHVELMNRQVSLASEVSGEASNHPNTRVNPDELAVLRT